jgi:outer membrane lipase/esterase
LFADAEGHLSTAGQKIAADYFYSLVAAPSVISMLAENAVKVRNRLVSDIQTQIETSQAQHGPNGITAWVTGDIGHLSIDNYPGLPDDPSTPLALAAGISYRISNGLLVGAAVSTGHNSPTFALGFGGFEQDEVTGSLYAAARSGPIWGNVVGTYGALSYDVNRTVPIGITVQNNTGTTHGDDWSLAVQGGYDLHWSGVKLGPVVGALLQRVTVDGFTETGSFTSLGFADQTRDSAVLQLGWRASTDIGIFHPFAQLTWNHEFADTDRNVTASLTTTIAPSYYMPAVKLGDDWGTGVVGTRVDLGSGVVAVGSFTGEFGQGGATSYGGQIGLNVAF